jgi:hypothetical protein
MICHDNYDSDENSSLSLLYTGKLDVSHLKLPYLYGCAILSYMQIGVSVLVEGRIPENGVPKAAFHALLTEHFEIPKFLFFHVTPKLHRHLSAQSNRSQIPNFPSISSIPSTFHPSILASFGAGCLKPPKNLQFCCWRPTPRATSSAATWHPSCGSWSAMRPSARCVSRPWRGRGR